MTKARKIDILYKRAKGQSCNVTPTEEQELYMYKVDEKEGDFYTTRANITDYVTAVDNGCRLPFYDWCMNNGRADKRRKGSSEKAIAQRSNEKTGAGMMVGWLTWGAAIYWICNEQIPVVVCAVAGAIISYVLTRNARKSLGFTILVLPLLLLSFFCS